MPSITLEEQIRKWKAGDATTDDRRTLSRELGNKRHEPGIPILIAMLTDPDEIVRYNAVTGLGLDLRHKTVSDNILDLLVNDTDADVRDAAAGALRAIWENSENEAVMRALAHAALKDADEGVRQNAYISLLVVKGITQQEHLRLLRTGEQTVDHTVLNQILDEMKKKGSA